jgi:Ca-activated chloride channel homolog
VRVRALLLLALLGVCSAARSAGGQAVRDKRPFRSGIELTAVAATVVDSDGRLVTGLPQDAFEVYEDGQLQQITQFTHDRVPLGIGILLDISDSMFGQRIKDARTAVERFLFELLNPEDEVFVLTFNHDPETLIGWTNARDGSRAREALDNLRPSGGTAIYDAVAKALPLLETRSRERGSILIISDGADTASTITLRDLRSALHRSDVFAYAIAIDSPDRVAINTSVNPMALREITDDSGGRTQVVSSSGELVAALVRISEELNSQYVLGYTSPRSADWQYHSIRVKVRGADYQVRARRGYVADPRPATSTR